MIAVSKELLGKGIYTPSEAAFFARVRTQTMNRWMFGNAQGNPVVRTELDSEERTVTFLDFVQALAIRNIRTKHNIPLQKIRQAVDTARQNGIDFPFAVKHKTYIFGDQHGSGHGEIVIDVNERLIQASGKSRGNLMIREVAELYMHALEFDEATGLANRYTAWTTPTGRSIVMDPDVRFGEPVLKCGYTASTLWDAYQTEGGVEQAAMAYAVEKEDVYAALEFYDYLISTSAA